MKETLLLIGEWESIRYCVDSFPDFEAEMYKLLKDPVIEKTKLTLPNYVTVQERYKIHRFTKRNDIEPRSYGEDENRYMEIVFSKKYIQSLHDRFYIEPVQNIPEPPPSQITLEEFKHRILVDIMGVIDRHLSNEYINYFN